MRKAALFTLGALGLALPVSAAIVSIGSNDARECYLAAENRQANTETLSFCDRALASVRDSNYAATLVNRGVLHLVSERRIRAMSDFDAALASEPRNAEAWLNKGVVLMQGGKPGEAVVALSKALAFGTSRPAVAHLARAYANENLGAYREAFRDLRTAASLSPRWSVPRRELARYRVRGAGQGAH